jgi:hypothetical protein
MIELHRWGESKGADRVWSHISGLRPSAANTRCFFVIQAYIDDSVTEGGTFVLAGAISTAAKWAAFSAEWEQMLDHGLMGSNGQKYFKMSEMAQNPERMSRVPWFYTILANHTICLLSFSFNLADLASAQSRILVPGHGVSWDKFGSPYILAMRSLFDMFHLALPKLLEWMSLPLGAKVDFIFDERAEKRQVHALWDSYISLWGEDVRARFGNEPRFENDQDFLPLQGADLWAWWVRAWEEKGRDPSFPFPKVAKGAEHPIWIGLNQTEEDLLKIMAGIASRAFPGVDVIDRRTGVKIDPSGAVRSLPVGKR